MMDYAADDATFIAARLKELAKEREPKPLTWETAWDFDLDEFAAKWGLKRAGRESDDDLRKRIASVVYCDCGC